MGLGNFLGLPSSFSSSSSSSRPRGGNPPPLGPGSSKFDYAYGLNPPGPSTSPGLAQSFFQGYNDAPPAYSPQNSPGFNDYATDVKMPMQETTHTGMAHLPTPVVDNTLVDSKGEASLQMLIGYDIVIILDDSYSMLDRDTPGGKTRWDQAWDALERLVEEGFKYDKDGIDLHFLNQKHKDRKIKSLSQLKKLRKEFRLPIHQTCTPTGDVLDVLLRQYRNMVEPDINLIKKNLSPAQKKRIFLIITDGDPTDSPEEAIVDAAKFFQANGFPLSQVGIQFLQVGDDPEATEFLRKLDVGFGDYTRDIVDTIKSDGKDLKGDGLIKALTGGINRKQDKKGEK